MSDSTITKRAIADGLKSLVPGKKSFDKVSISDITSACGLNRQTFYYHFQDKYELLNWIYYTEGFSRILDGITFENWPERFHQLLDIMKENQGFYMNTIKCEESCFGDYLLEITAALFEAALEKLDTEHHMTPEDKSFFSQFYSYGICGVLLSWVKSGMRQPTKQVAANLHKLAKETEQFSHLIYTNQDLLS